MNISLTDVSQLKLRKKGFLNASVIINKDMILLFKVDKDVVLDNHNHPHTQLGYCINGAFDFEVEGNHFDVSKGHSYLLQDRVYHSAVAATDYYAMDIKVILENDSLPQRMRQNVFETVEENENLIVKTSQVGRCKVQKILYLERTAAEVTVDLNRRYFIVVSEACRLHFGSLTADLYVEPMKIYQLQVDTAQFSIATDKGMEILVIEY